MKIIIEIKKMFGIIMFGCIMYVWFMVDAVSFGHA